MPRRSRWSTRDHRRAVRNRRRRTYDERAALTLQEISRKKPGVENRVAQEIEEAITARAFGWIDDAISASTIALRRRRSGVGTRHRNGDKERFPASYVESVGRSGQDVRLA